MDSIDSSILRLVQDDAELSIQEIAAKVGLSSTPCWRRIQRLEEAGVIRNQHNQVWWEKLKKAVVAIPEVVEFYRMSGEIDYLLRVVVPDIAAYDEVYKRLIEAVDLYDVSSSFAMEQIKYTTALPVHYAADKEAP